LKRISYPSRTKHFAPIGGKRGGFTGVHRWKAADYARLSGTVAPTSSVYFRSRMEANWARYLEAQRSGRLLVTDRPAVANWIYEPLLFPFDRNRYRANFDYRPDFLVVFKDGSYEVHEVKAVLDAKSNTKLARMGRHFPDVPVRIIDWPVYKSVADKLGPIIADWERRGSET